MPTTTTHRPIRLPDAFALYSNCHGIDWCETCGKCTHLLYLRTREGVNEWNEPEREFRYICGDDACKSVADATDWRTWHKYIGNSMAPAPR